MYSTYNRVMTDKDITEQEVYSLFIPGSTLGPNSKLRLKALLSRRQGQVIECCAPPCTDITNPGTQELSEIETYDLDTGAVEMTWAYVGPGPEIYGLRVTPTCGGGNGTYDSCTELVHVLNGVITIRNDLRPALDTTPAANLICGNSDEHSYLFYAGNGYYFSIDDQQRTVMAPQTGDISLEVDAWTKYDDRIYVCINQFAFGNSRRVRVYEVGSGTHVEFSDVLTGYTFITNMQANERYLYALVRTSGNNKLVRVERSDLTTKIEIDLGTTGFNSIYVVSDTAVYLVKQINFDPISVYFWDGVTLNLVDGAVTLSTNVHGTTGNHRLSFLNRILFYGGDSAGGVNIALIEVACP